MLKIDKIKAFSLPLDAPFFLLYIVYIFPMELKFKKKIRKNSKTKRTLLTTAEKNTKIEQTNEENKKIKIK